MKPIAVTGQCVCVCVCGVYLNPSSSLCFLRRRVAPLFLSIDRTLLSTLSGWIYVNTAALFHPDVTGSLRSYVSVGWVFTCGACVSLCRQMGRYRRLDGFPAGSAVLRCISGVDMSAVDVQIEALLQKLQLRLARILPLQSSQRPEREHKTHTLAGRLTLTERCS